MYEEDLEKFRKELEDLDVSENRILKALEEYKQVLIERDAGVPKNNEWYEWYFKNYLKPKIIELNQQYYRLSEKQKQKLEDRAHNWLMENRIDEIESSMPQHLKEQKQQWIEENLTEETQPLYEPIGIWKICHNPTCNKRFRARRQTQKYCSIQCYRRHVSLIYMKNQQKPKF